MLITDPVGDLITRIRNGQSARKKVITVPASSEREALLTVLVEGGYLSTYVRDADAAGHPILTVTLKYVNGRGAIQSIKRVSSPGRRIYSSVKKLMPVMNGLGIAVLSTSKGVISDATAREIGAGGEVLCSVF
ncbi:MAG: 30S ribosomal protein S8 [Holosporales bacterium]|jgi:small subunit ribosomal protein S8|nr:30S ribosomal protein S8 [Holosporales bacterium]